MLSDLRADPPSGSGNLARREGAATQPPERAPPQRGAEAAGASAPAAADTTAGTAAGTTTDTTAVLMLARLAPGSRLWGWSRIVRGAAPLAGEPGLRFARVMGSGHEGGFGLRPSLEHQGLFTVFDSLDAAAAFLARSPMVARYRERSAELCTLLLRPWSVRGRWGGHTFVPTPGPAPAGPVLALTRASIKPLRAAGFWAMAPAAQADLGRAEGCRLAAGLGEAPLLRQCTVSLWDSVAAMDAYARTGPHLAAIRAAAQQGFFSESMFARFTPLQVEGRWQGRVHG